MSLCSRKISLKLQAAHNLRIADKYQGRVSAAYVLNRDSYNVNLATRKIETITFGGTGHSLSNDNIATYGSGYFDFPIGSVSTTGFTLITSYKFLSGSVPVSMLSRSGYQWTGVYIGEAVSVVSSSAASFDGVVSPTAGYNGDTFKTFVTSYSGNNLRAAINGGAVTSDTSATQISDSYLGSLALGAAVQIGSIDNYAAAEYHFIAVLQGTVSNSELIVLSQNPYSIFEPRTRQVFFTSASAPADLSGLASSASSATGAITSQLTLSGANVSIATNTGSVTVAIPLNGVSSSAASAAGAVSSVNSLSGSDVAATIGIGALTSAIPLSGASASATIASGTMSLVMAISGASIASAIATAQANMSQSLSGEVITGASATGNVAITDSGFSGDAVSNTSGTGNITITIALSGTSVSDVLASAEINSVIPLIGNVQGVSSGIADLTSIDSGALLGTAQSIVSINGELSISIPLTGSAIGIATGTGDASSVVTLTGASASVSSATGDLQVQFDLSAGAIAQVISTGGLSVMVGLAGATVASTLTNASLYIDTMINAALQHRIYTILAENRLYTIPVDSQSYTIPRY